MAVKKAFKGKEGIYLITLPKDPKKSPKVFIEALEEIYMFFGSYEFIPWAYHSNGQLKTIFAICLQIAGAARD